MMMHEAVKNVVGCLLLVGAAASLLGAQNAEPAAPPSKPAMVAGAATPAPGAVTPPADYVIGPDDVLSVVFWKDKDFSGDVTVRPDGKITLPLINDLVAGGLTPAQFTDVVKKAASAFMQDDPAVTVQVKQINSRKVFIVGAVAKPQAYALTDHMTVLNLITIAGGLQEFATKDDIGVLRIVNGQPKRFKVNYEDIAKGKNLAQNIELKPGDQVVVR